MPVDLIALYAHAGRAGGWDQRRHPAVEAARMWLLHYAAPNEKVAGGLSDAMQVVCPAWTGTVPAVRKRRGRELPLVIGCALDLVDAVRSSKEQLPPGLDSLVVKLSAALMREQTRVGEGWRPAAADRPVRAALDVLEHVLERERRRERSKVLVAAGDPDAGHVALDALEAQLGAGAGCIPACRPMLHALRERYPELL